MHADTKPVKNKYESKQKKDTELVFRIKEGDEFALAELVDSYQKRILSAAFKITGNWQISQDIAQDVFITLMEKIDTFDPERNFFSWIYRVAINRAIDHVRKRDREYTFLESRKAGFDPVSETSEDILEKSEQRIRVNNVLSKLPVKYRTVLVLRDIEGVSTGKIADILDLEPPTARWRIYQARKLFKEVWESGDNDYEL